MSPYENPIECGAFANSTYLPPDDRTPEQQQAQEAGGRAAHQNARQRMPVGPPTVPPASLSPVYISVSEDLIGGHVRIPGPAGVPDARRSSTSLSPAIVGPVSSTRSTSPLVRTTSAPVLFEGVDPADLYTSVDYYLFNQNIEIAEAGEARNGVHPFVPTAPRPAPIMSTSGQIMVPQPQELLLHLLTSDDRPRQSAPLASTSFARGQVDTTVVESPKTSDADEAAAASANGTAGADVTTDADEDAAAAQTSTMLYPDDVNGDNSLIENSDCCKLQVFLIPPSPPLTAARDPPTFTWPPPPTTVNDEQLESQHDNHDEQPDVDQNDGQPEDGKPEADQ